MDNFFDILIYAAIAAFLFSRLWSVLGRREDDETPPARSNPFEPSEQHQQADEEDVMILEGRARPASDKTSVLTMAGHAPTSLAGGIDQIKAADPSFDEKRFIEGAKIAFSEIVAGFAKGDLAPIEGFLAPQIKESFEKAVKERENNRQRLENKVERFAAIDIVAARLEGAQAFLSVEFVSHQVNVVYDAAGAIVHGAAGQAEEVRDTWTFCRDTRAQDPNWLLVETRS